MTPESLAIETAPETVSEAVQKATQPDNLMGVVLTGTKVLMHDGKEYKVEHQFSDQRIVVIMKKMPVLAVFAGHHPDGFVFEPCSSPPTAEELTAFPSLKN